MLNAGGAPKPRPLARRVLRKSLVAAIAAVCAASGLLWVATPMSKARTAARQPARLSQRPRLRPARARHGDLVFGPIEIFCGDVIGDGAADAMAWT